MAIVDVMKDEDYGWMLCFVFTSIFLVYGDVI